MRLGCCCWYKIPLAWRNSKHVLKEDFGKFLLKKKKKKSFQQFYNTIKIISHSLPQNKCCQISTMTDIGVGLLAFRHGQFCKGWRHHNAILIHGGATCWPVWRVFDSPPSSIDNTAQNPYVPSKLPNKF